MNIALLTHLLSTHSGSRVAIELAIRFAKQRHQVTIYAFQSGCDRALYRLLLTHHITVTLLPNPSLWQILNWLRQTSKLFTRRRHDLLSIHASLLFHIAAKLSHLPTFTTYYGTQWSPLTERPWPKFVTTILNPLANILIWLKTFVIVQLNHPILTISRYCQTELRRFYFCNSTVIYLGGDSYFFPKQHSPVKNPPSLKTHNSQPIRLLSVSRLTPYKGFHHLINLLNQLASDSLLPPDCYQLTIAGSGPLPHYLKYLRQISKNLPVNFLLNPSDLQLSRLYSQSDVYLSLDRYLFFGLPIAEAAYFRIPTLAYNYAASHELILTNQTGFVVNNNRQFSNQLIKLIRNPTLRKSLGIRASSYARAQFSWELTSKKYLKVFQDTVQPHL